MQSLTELDTPHSNGTSSTPELYSVKEAAKKLGISPSHVYRLTYNGTLRKEEGPSVYFTKAHLDEYQRMANEQAVQEVTPEVSEKVEQDELIVTVPERTRAVYPVPEKPWTTHTLHLVSGGSITITYQIDLFEASTQDRELLLKIVDAMRTYEKPT